MPQKNICCMKAAERSRSRHDGGWVRLEPWIGKSAVWCMDATYLRLKLMQVSCDKIMGKISFSPVFRG